MDSGGGGRVTILCPREIAAFSADRGLYWLIGSPLFLPPITIVSVVRCLHFLDGSPDYISESDDLRTLVIRGFDVIGVLRVEDEDYEESARKAIEATLMLRKHFRNDDCHGGVDFVVGAAGSMATKEVRFFGSELKGSYFSLKPITSVLNNVGNAEKFVWENSCLLRCQIEFRLPVYFQEGNTSDVQRMFSSATQDVIAKLRDPGVAFLIEGTSTGSPSVVLHGAEIYLESSSGSFSQVHAVTETGKMSLPCSHFLRADNRLQTYNLGENADLVRVTVLSNKSRNDQNCNAPTAHLFSASSSTKLVISTFKLDVLGYSSKNSPASLSISRLIVPGLIDQLIAMSKIISSKILSQPQLHPYHFLPSGILHPITTIYELTYGETEMLQVEIRKALHLRMGLPVDRPLLRVANSLTFGSGGNNLLRTGAIIRDVHVDIARSGVSGGLASLIEGSYEYYHYLQDGLDDNGWGCAYRSLQTIISWFRLQHYTSLQVPSHREIQQTLVKIGDKEPSFVGSREWIGAIELSFVLDALLGVSCKIINVRSGAELPEKCRELSLHFRNQGTPVMIGGGVLAYTLLGVDYNDASGDCAFLILDPHYTGGDDRKKITSGGWCGWKKPVDSKGRNFFLHDKFYNLLLPQRPNMV